MSGWFSWVESERIHAPEPILPHLGNRCAKARSKVCKISAKRAGDMVIHLVIHSEWQASRRESGRLLRATLTAGQVSIAPELIRGLRHCRIVADKGCDSGLMRETACKSRSRSCIPKRDDGKRKGSFHRGYYRKRHQVENFLQRIKRQRRVAARYDKLAEVFFNFILLASILEVRSELQTL
ncbi:MAG: hypothetical protein EOP84_20335 [Verrucomicrobiaceae bacterium]|nr:MAG: hypothetical protein EOP84_20335 [Verrucomicrobiaceae bacterium]